jgi:mannose-6-phosphate isomerase-like protein (cupin superfamily)
MLATGFLAVLTTCGGQPKSPPRASMPAVGVMEAQGTGPAPAPSGSEAARPPPNAPFEINIRQAALGSDAYRRVLFTGMRSQTVLMTLPAGQDIGADMHPNVEQLIFIVAGVGKAILNGAESTLGPGDLLVLPAGTRHDVVNTGQDPLRLYTVYVPPNHIDGRVHQTKAEAEADTADEEFGRSVR